MPSNAKIPRNRSRGADIHLSRPRGAQNNYHAPGPILVLGVARHFCSPRADLGELRGSLGK